MRHLTVVPYALAGALLLLGGCLQSSPNEVVVYSALDGEFSEPILQQFEQDRNHVVRANFDVESTKTVGLVTRIIAERQQPRCDVFWNNEILHTLRLQERGLLEPFVTPAAESFPENYRAEDGSWYGLAARARVLIVNTELVAEDQRPSSIHDLVDPKWKDQVAVAKPLFGTTASHAAVLFALWGPERAKEFFAQLKDNARIMSGNKQVALAVARGEAAFGLTDTDDAVIEQEAGHPVTMVYPDQGEDQMGTLFIPNTICIVKDCPHPEAARVLIEYLLQPQVEIRLAEGPSAQFPVNHNVDQRSRVAPTEPVRWADVDFRQAAEAWDEASEFLRERFAAAE